jgi:hypothetical protein
MPGDQDDRRTQRGGFAQTREEQRTVDTTRFTILQTLARESYALVRGTFLQTEGHERRRFPERAAVDSRHRE